MLKAEHIRKAYGKKQILCDLSLTAESGEQIAIVGRNGCGKTTFLQILAGIIRPDGGTLSVFGKDLLKNPKAFAACIGYVPQENALIEALSVRDNLRLWTGKSTLPDDAFLTMFGLPEILDTKVAKLSGGMKRRLCIGCAAANWPPVLLMDEPTSALDHYYRDIIHAWMKQYLYLNGILIIATHDETEMKASSRCCQMEDGRLILS